MPKRHQLRSVAIIAVILAVCVAIFAVAMYRASKAYVGVTRHLTISELSHETHLKFPPETLLAASEMHKNWRATDIRAKVEMPRSAIGEFAKTNRLSAKNTSGLALRGMKPDPRVPWWDTPSDDSGQILAAPHDSCGPTMLVLVRPDKSQMCTVYLYYFQD